MFFHFTQQLSSNLRQTVLLINTALLIAALIIVELVYSETSKRKRQELRYFYPLFIVLVGLLLYAFYVQRKGL